MRFFVMFVTAVCVLFLIKLRWPKKKNFYDNVCPYYDADTELGLIRSEPHDFPSLQNSRNFWRISGEKRRKRGEREARVACEGIRLCASFVSSPTPPPT